MRNFYLADSLRSACTWALRDNLAAVVVFVIPDSYISNLPNHIELEWVDFIYNLRSKPIRSASNYKQKIAAYKELVKDVDKNNLISGPILANPDFSSKENMRIINYGNYIPYQFSFKDTTIGDLNDMIGTIIFFSR